MRTSGPVCALDRGCVAARARVVPRPRRLCTQACWHSATEGPVHSLHDPAFTLPSKTAASAQRTCRPHVAHTHAARGCCRRRVYQPAAAREADRRTARRARPRLIDVESELALAALPVRGGVAAACDAGAIGQALAGRTSTQAKAVKACDRRFERAAKKLALRSKAVTS